MKSKISITVEQSLLEFLDRLPGESRSQKIEGALIQFKKAVGQAELRRTLGGYSEDDAERLEREAWENTVAEVMWSE